jgi:hypothetical protein
MAFWGHTTTVFSDEYERVKKERNLITCKHVGSACQLHITTETKIKNRDKQNNIIWQNNNTAIPIKVPKTRTCVLTKRKEKTKNNKTHCFACGLAEKECWWWGMYSSPESNNLYKTRFNSFSQYIKNYHFFITMNIASFVADSLYIIDNGGVGKKNYWQLN